MTTTTTHPGPRKAFTPHAIALAAAALLSACGGGGGSGYGDVPAAASLGLSGTAATGAALAGAAVEAKCATGSGSATTASDGTYTLNISNGVLPCVARVTGSGGLVLHTVIAGTGSRAVGNLTPATQLIVARLAAGDPASYYSAFNASAAGAITPAVVAAAQAAVVATLKPGSLDFSTIAAQQTTSRFLPESTCPSRKRKWFSRHLPEPYRWKNSCNQLASMALRCREKPRCCIAGNLFLSMANLSQ